MNQTVNGRRQNTYIGSYNNPRMAALARDLIAWHRYGDYAVTNFPRDQVAALWKLLKQDMFLEEFSQ